MQTQWWTDAEKFLDTSAGFCAEHPLLTNVAASVALNAREHTSTDAEFGMVHDDDGEPQAVAVWNPGRPLFISHPRQQAAEAIGRHVAEHGIDVHGVTASSGAVKAFAGALGRGDCLARKSRSMSLLGLTGALNTPSATVGHAREATVDDVQVLQEWIDKLTQETHDRPFTVVRDADDYRHSLRVWTLNDKPVAMAQLTPPSAGVQRISWVYTPPKYHGRSYELVLACYLAETLKAEGHDPCVFVDGPHHAWAAALERAGFRQLMMYETWVISEHGIDE